MTEAGWLACDGPERVPGVLTRPADRPLIGDRELRPRAAGRRAVSGARYRELDLVNPDALHGAARGWSR